MEKASGGQQRACVWCASSSEPSEPAEHPRDETGLDDSAPPQPSRSFGVVITGSTKGIGLAMARTHLALGDRVVINSRDADRVQASVAELTAEFGDDNVSGVAANVSLAQDAKLLAKEAAEFLGEIDVWVNNAGTNGYYYGSLLDTDTDIMSEIIETNLLGSMLCCREALAVMRDQEGGGVVFNMDGAGSSGSPTPRFAAYGATKAAIPQLTSSISAELKSLDIADKVSVHTLSPGMVTTDLLMAGADTKVSKFFINILAETPDKPAGFLVPRVRSLAAEAQEGARGMQRKPQKSVYIKFLTDVKAYSAMMRRVLLGENKDRYVPEDSYLPFL